MKGKDMSETPPQVSAFRHSWLNGGRKMIVVAAVFVAAMLLLSSAIIYVTVRSLTATPPNPLKSPSPEQVINAQDSYKPGQVITVLGTKCNNGKVALFITGVSYYERQEISGPEAQVGNKNNGGREIAPGCQTLQFPHTLPAELTPGMWRLEGTDCTATGPVEPVPTSTVLPPVAPTVAPTPAPSDSRFCASWYTDTFRVVAP